MKITYTKQFIKDAKKYPQFKNKIKEVVSTKSKVAFRHS